GHYYADRIRSATHLAFYDRTYDHAELQRPYNDLRLAIDDWDRLAEVADNHFGFVTELIRMGVNHFQWKEEGRMLALDLDQINKLELDYEKLPSSPAFHPTIGHVPLFKAKPHEAVILNASVVGLTRPRRPHGLSVFYRNSA